VRQIIWSDRANTDFDAAFDFAQTIGGDHAERLLGLLEDAQRLLVAHPQAGGAIRGRRFRKWLLRPLPYALLYETRTDSILIIRLIHLHTDWQSVL
jgi:toxin ParE1/3/4